MNPASNLRAATRGFRQLPLLPALAVALSALGSNWPQWRGPEGTGVSTETNLPLHWGMNENIRWRVPLPDRGNSTPILWGTKVFVTQATTKDHRRALICL